MPAAVLETESTNPREDLRLALEASPDPWWGFNGVHTLLAVTGDRLWLIRPTLLAHGKEPTRGRVRGSSLPRDIQDVTSTVRRELLGSGWLLTLRLRVAGRRGRLLYTAKDVDAKRRLVDLLRAVF